MLGLEGLELRVSGLSGLGLRNLSLQEFSKRVLEGFAFRPGDIDMAPGRTAAGN